MIDLSKITNWIDPNAYNTTAGNVPRFTKLYWSLAKILPIEKYHDLYRGYYNDIQVMRFKSSLHPGHLTYVNGALNYWNTGEVDTNNNFHLGEIKEAKIVTIDDKKYIRIDLKTPKDNSEWLVWFNNFRCSKLAIFVNDKLDQTTGQYTKKLYQCSFNFIKRINDGSFLITPYDTDIELLNVKELVNGDIWESGVFTRLSESEITNTVNKTDLKNRKSIADTIDYYRSQLETYKRLQLPPNHFQMKLTKANIQYYEAALARYDIENKITPGDLNLARQREEEARDYLLSLKPPSIEEKIFHALSKCIYSKTLEIYFMNLHTSNFIDSSVKGIGTSISPNYLIFDNTSSFIAARQLTMNSVTGVGNDRNVVLIRGTESRGYARLDNEIVLRLNIPLFFGLSQEEFKGLEFSYIWGIKEFYTRRITTVSGGSDTADTAEITHYLNTIKGKDHIILKAKIDGMGTDGYSLNGYPGYQGFSLTVNLIRKSDFKSVII